MATRNHNRQIWKSKQKSRKYQNKRKTQRIKKFNNAKNKCLQCGKKLKFNRICKICRIINEDTNFKKDLKLVEP